MTTILIVCIAALVIVIGLAIRSRRSRDAVADFRRQIDALSPEARRDVTDRVRRIGESGTDNTEEDGQHGA